MKIFIFRSLIYQKTKCRKKTMYVAVNPIPGLLLKLRFWVRGGAGGCQPLF